LFRRVAEELFLNNPHAYNLYSFAGFVKHEKQPLQGKYWKKPETGPAALLPVFSSTVNFPRKRGGRIITRLDFAA
jgi:hypothetical protein